MTPEPTSEHDLKYVRANFRTLANLCGAWGERLADVDRQIAGSLLPRFTYLVEGTGYYPDDLFVFPREELERERKSAFISRLRTAFSRVELPITMSDAEETWTEYLAGTFGACLRTVLPETIARKAHLISRIASALESPRPESNSWRNRLAADVDALDALLRPFAEIDRVIAGRPVSRDTYIEAPRARFLLGSDC